MNMPYLTRLKCLYTLEAFELSGSLNPQKIQAPQNSFFSFRKTLEIVRKASIIFSQKFKMAASNPRWPSPNKQANVPHTMTDKLRRSQIILQELGDGKNKL